MYFTDDPCEQVLNLSAEHLTMREHEMMLHLVRCIRIRREKNLRAANVADEVQQMMDGDEIPPHADESKLYVRELIKQL